MDQHPVPQNISSYEFRLVGDMTLKQFFQLAGGIAVALIFYRTPFPGLIKWPLMFLSVLGGILLAFVPLQGRPFSQWIIAFFKAVYSPTKYFWRPEPTAALYAENGNQRKLDAENLALNSAPASPLDNLEAQMFSKFSDLFNSVTHLNFSRPAAPPQPAHTAAPSPPAQSSSPPRPPEIPAQPAEQPLTNLSNRRFLEAVGLTPFASHSTLSGTAAPMANMMSVFTPTQPNILAGIVADPAEKAVEGAILEIAEKTSGTPVRALRSNKLGQFQIATPLPDGEYVITADREGYHFEPLVISVSGQIIKPIKIIARPAS